MVTKLDRAALATYCGAYALWAEATEAIQKFGDGQMRIIEHLAHDFTPYSAIALPLYLYEGRNAILVQKDMIDRPD
jgi:hypothetical protein